MSDLDKDIERCKELIKTEHSNWIGMSNQDAISNVLSELEKKDIEIEVLKRQVDVDNIILEKQDKEAETWKKIAEKLAEELSNYKFEEIICMQTDCEHIEIQNGGKCIGDKECIIDWARKEVEKDES